MRLRLIAFVSFALAFAFVPRPARSGVCSDWTAGPLGGPNGADGAVLAMTNWDPDGVGPAAPVLVAAGGFEHVQGVPAGHIASRNATTGQWQTLGRATFPALGVNGLTVYNGDLIAGGSFLQIGGVDANRVARWDGTAWQPLGTGTSQEVRAVTVYNGELIAAGSFTTAGGVAANNIARWNGTIWQPLGTGTNAIVLALMVFNGELIAGGSFTQAGGITANRIAKWNGTSWSALGTGMNTSVYGLGAYASQIIACGAFTSAGGSAANRIARWNGASWLTLGTGMNDAVRCVGIYGSDLIAGGRFTTAGGIAASSIAKWNGASWSALGAGIWGAQVSPPLPAEVFSLGQTSGWLVAGGIFENAGTGAASRIARWDVTQWAPFGGGVANGTNALASYNGRMVLGGNFTHTTPLANANYIVGWDGVRLSAFGTGMNNVVYSLEGFKYPGASGNYELIAGGAFTVAGGVAANHIARWVEDPFVAFPPPAWQPMGAGFNAEVQALRRYNNATYAGGGFTSPVNHIARWNETTDVWEDIGGINGSVRALEEYNGMLYAGGEFSTAGGVTTNALARWNGTSWSAVGTFTGIVYALEVHDGRLVIGGSFSGPSSSTNLVQYDGVSFTKLGLNGTDAPIRALGSAGGRLYIGGSFTEVNGLPVDNLAAWDGIAWSGVQGGTDGTVLALAPHLNELAVAGIFTDVDQATLTSPTFARFRLTGAPWIVYEPASLDRTPGQDASFNVTPSAGDDGLTYQWFKYGVPIANGPTVTGSTIAGATSEMLRVLDVTPSDGGQYHVVVSNGCGADTSLIATLTIDGAVGAPPVVLPTATVFEALGPNPSAGPTRLAFTLAREAHVRVLVHDVSGRRVHGMDVGRLAAGRHHAEWDGRGANGEAVGAGLFFVTLEIEGRTLLARRLTILR